MLMLLLNSDARNPKAAGKARSRIQEIIDLLLTFPNMGHKGKLPGTPETVVLRLPYIIFIGSKATQTKRGWQSSVFIAVPSVGPDGGSNASYRSDGQSRFHALLSGS
jgi:hypothetical protein